MPKVSVLLPVYNAEIHIQEAIESLLNQSLSDFEIIAIDDGSSDSSIELLKKITDPRLKIFQNLANMGISDTLNKCIELASGEYLARMDSDDICNSERFEKQVKYLDLHSDIDILGSNIRIFGSTVSRVIRNQPENKEIKAGLFFNPAFAHPTVMIRRSSLNKLTQIYDPAFNKAEDFELWTRAALSMNFANIDEPLLNYRVHATQISTASAKKQAELASTIRSKFFKMLEIPFTDDQFALHEKICHWSFSKMSNSEFEQTIQWMELLGEYAEKRQFTTKEAVFKEFCNRFTIAYYNNYYRLNFRKKVKAYGLFKPELVTSNEKYIYLLKSARDVAGYLKKKTWGQIFNQ